MIRWWVDLLDRRETPEVLALVRAGLGLVVVSDLFWTWRLGLIVPLMAAEPVGLAGPARSTWHVWVGGGPAAATTLFAALLVCAVAFGAGFFSRTSALLYVLLSAEWARILPDADRGIDTMMRNAILLLAFSSAGAAFSVDAWWSTGSVRGSGAPVPSWPRRLLVLQIVVMYFTAGVQKYAQHWWPWGGWSALYVILQDWAVAAADFSFLSHPVLYASTQLATAVTMAWQWTYPVVLWTVFEPPWPPGRIRAWFVRRRAHWAWIAVGMWFHVALALTMELGIFPYGMLAMYWVFLAPDELPSWLRARPPT